MSNRADEDLDGPEERTVPEVPSAVAAAPTATTALVPGRRRRLALALVVLVVGAAAVAAVVFLSGDYQQRRELRAASEAILARLADGKAEEVYEKASPRFQQTLLIDRFEGVVRRMNATLGRFVRTTDVVGMGRAVGVAGMTAWVLLELEFQRGSTTGQFSFLRVFRDGRPTWLLLGFNVEIPPERAAQATALEAQEQRMGAPDEVIDLVRSILQGVREGRAAEVYESASPAFKRSFTVEGFTAMLQSHQAPLGNFVRVLAIISSAQSPERYRANVQALLEYEKGKTTGTFEFMRIDGTWRLLSFKIVIPFGDTLPAEKPR